MHIKIRNTNDIMPIIFSSFKNWPAELTRNGIAYTYPEPVLITYEHPEERVNFCPVRDANPFFHLFEAMWMLAGRRDVEWIANVLPKMRDFSDDGITFNGAYGWRMRRHWRDQLLDVVQHLIADPGSRRAVIQLWSAEDGVINSVDKPCNTQMMFRLRDTGDGDEYLDLTVTNRSNDAVWGGVCGSNVVHFSIFQEVVATALSAGIGRLHVLSNNLHIYRNKQASALHEHYSKHLAPVDYYDHGIIPILGSSNIIQFLKETQLWCQAPMGTRVYKNPFFNDVLCPMYNSYFCQDRREGHDRLSSHAVSCDWKDAGLAWLERRFT